MCINVLYVSKNPHAQQQYLLNHNVKCCQTNVYHATVYSLSFVTKHISHHEFQIIFCILNWFRQTYETDCSNTARVVSFIYSTPCEQTIQTSLQKHVSNSRKQNCSLPLHSLFRQWAWDSNFLIQTVQRSMPESRFPKVTTAAVTKL